MTQFSNPLKQYFRQPAIYMRLPTGGKYWPSGTIDMPQNGEIPVYPMTAIDEITYRTPDALFNGQAVVSVIQSCIPSVKNAWAAPSADVNSMLVAIRLASYGHELEISSTCPACQTVEDYAVDLRNVLDQLKLPDFETTLQYGDLEIAFTPVSYEQQNRSNQSQFDEQQMIRSATDSDMPEDEKLKRLNDAMRRITELTIEAIKWSIAGIRTPSAIVSEPEYIQEFLLNSDRKLFSLIRDRVIDLRKISELKPLDIKCGNCSHEYHQTITLDMTSFFGAAS
jgi:bacterioferritin-associated ferredoxin